MTDREPATYRTGPIWLVTGGLLLAGTLGSAFVVYGLTGLLGGGPWWADLPALGMGAAVAIYALLLLVGILYRIDRLRGVAHRRVDLFE